jgi:hypothetical protein
VRYSNTDKRKHFYNDGTQKCRVHFRGNFVSLDQEDDWRAAYQAALLEVDPAKLPERIEQAYKAIQVYMGLARQNSERAEYEALADALANLRVLRREVDLPVNPPNRKESESSASNR